ncbi:hypothetical protein ACLOJK_012345 [Asimina triloba]
MVLLALGEISRSSPFCCFYSTGFVRFQSEDSDFEGTARDECNSRSSPASKVQPQPTGQYSKNARDMRSFKIGENVSKKDKMNFLVKALFDLKDSKEAVYGALDAWVSWEQDFPLVLLKKTLVMLEKEEQWHRVIQVIKWMLSKGQGTTMGTYGQLIRALDKDHRAEEAHNIWVKKVGHDLHSVPWQLCHLMISIYYRNNMLERLVKTEEDTQRDNHMNLPQVEVLVILVDSGESGDKVVDSFHDPYWYLLELVTVKHKDMDMYLARQSHLCLLLHSRAVLFKGLEAFDRKPPDKAIVQKVADAYEMLGMLEDQKRILEKYKDLFTKSDIRSSKKSRKSSQKNKKKGGTTLPP